MRRRWLMLGVVLSLCMVVAILPRYPKVDTLGTSDLIRTTIKAPDVG